MILEIWFYYGERNNKFFWFNLIWVICWYMLIMVMNCIVDVWCLIMNGYIFLLYMFRGFFLFGLEIFEVNKWGYLDCFVLE